jgi:hypothetical protein
MSDVRIDCSSTRYKYMFAFAALMVLVFPIGVPTLFWWSLRRKRDQLYPRNLGRIIRVEEDPTERSLAVEVSGYLLSQHDKELLHADILEAVAECAPPAGSQQHASGVSESGPPCLPLAEPVTPPGPLADVQPVPSAAESGLPLAVVELVPVQGRWRAEQREGSAQDAASMQQDPPVSDVQQFYHYVIREDPASPPTDAKCAELLRAVADKWHVAHYDRGADEQARSECADVQHLDFLFEVSFAFIAFQIKSTRSLHTTTDNHCLR